MTRQEDGAVTAETAAVLPVMVVLTLSLAWLVALGFAQVRVIDAARETARAVARGDAPASALGLGRRVAPDGATVTLAGAGAGAGAGGGAVRVQVSSPVPGPAGLFSRWAGVRVHAEAVAAREPGS